MYRRKDNLLLHGLPEQAWETGIQCEQAVRECISTKMNINTESINFLKVHRIGPRSRNGRPILVRFDSPKDRQAVWKAKRDIQNTQDRENVFVTQDFPPEIQARRRRLVPILKKAKESSEFRNESFLRDDKLVIKGVTYTVNNMSSIPAPLTPWMLTTRKDDKYTFFWSANSPLSNHHPCVFEIDGTRYNCSEQIYMHQMAIVDDDFEKATEIMEADDPAVQKRTGKKIKRAQDWDKLCQG